MPFARRETNFKAILSSNAKNGYLSFYNERTEQNCVSPLDFTFLGGALRKLAGKLAGNVVSLSLPRRAYFEHSNSPLRGPGSWVDPHFKGIQDSTMKDPWEKLSSGEKEGIAARLVICSKKRMQELTVDSGNLDWYTWQPGVLRDYGSIPESTDMYMGGLTKEGTFFMLVPSSLVEQRQRAWLEHLARIHLATDDPERICAYCEQAQKEFRENMNPRPHPAFEADAQARQVEYWFSLLKYRGETTGIE